MTHEIDKATSDIIVALMRERDEALARAEKLSAAIAASQPAPDCHQPGLVTSDGGHAIGWPSDEPRQIVCTGEDGSDVWNCAFGTWSADDFGIDSDEPVGDGERLFVNRRLYDAAIARAIKAEDTIAALDVQPLTVQDAARVPEIASCIYALRQINKRYAADDGRLIHSDKQIMDYADAALLLLDAALRAIAEGRA